MQWFSYTVSRETDGELLLKGGLIKADTASEAADLIEGWYPGFEIAVQPWAGPGV